MHNRDAHQVTMMVVQALQATKQRGVLLSGWNGLTPLPNTEQFYFAQSIPHSWLFPQTAGVVHHGGAGSTAAGLRAGVPSLVIPYMADQPFWGQHVHALGVGPKPIPRIQLTAKRLAESFQQMVTDQEMIRRAADLGSRIRAEDGIARAVEHLESYYRQHLAEKQIR
jgi:UDP:flavonoid glycosyltransferase YjiC (YdhE family)